MSVIYEVNLTVEKGIAAEYREWLDIHAQEMLALPGFRNASIVEQEAEESAGTHTLFCTRYELDDQAALDEYLRVHSARMRADGVSRFGDRFRASRRVLGGSDSY